MATRNFLAPPLFRDHGASTFSADGDGVPVFDGDGEEFFVAPGRFLPVMSAFTFRSNEWQLSHSLLFREYGTTGTYSFEGDGEMVVGDPDPVERVVTSMGYAVDPNPPAEGGGGGGEVNPAEVNSDMIRNW